MALDTNTKKKTSSLTVQSIADLYWGGEERRITGLTVRIIGVNIVALLVLFFVFLYMGRYHSSVIEAKLQYVGAEALLVSSALSESTLSDDDSFDIDQKKLTRLATRLANETRQHIQVFDAQGIKIWDSKKIQDVNDFEQPRVERFDPVKILVKFISFLLPRDNPLKLYPATDSHRAQDYPDVVKAYTGRIFVSAWRNANEHIFLSTAAPLERNGRIEGVVLLTHVAYDIEQEISNVWRNIAAVFFVTLIIMVALSIYLSGVIARPIKRLARAAEGVRKGALGYSDIPDYSANHDEIGELSIVLRQMTKALYDRMNAIENFAADVAHELKNPLTSLRSAVETLQVVKKKPDRDKLFEIIQHDLERINRLITDISKSSRIDAALSRAKLVEVDIKSVISNLLDVYRTPLARQNHDMHVEINGVKVVVNSEDDEGAVLVWGQAQPLYQVFENLLSNALSFSKKGSEIAIDISSEGAAVVVSIRDQGGGIQAKNISDIFGRFYSRRPEAEKYGEHSGLGLAICRQIVEAFDGQIVAENITDDAEKPIGACFSVILKQVL